MQRRQTDMGKKGEVLMRLEESGDSLLSILPCSWKQLVGFPREALLLCFTPLGWLRLNLSSR